MEIKYFCPLWGSKELDFLEFVKKDKTSGYDGIEMSLPPDKKEKEYILKKIKEHNLLYLAQHYETDSADYEVHKR
ncbi:hypothetical protein [Mariniphaga sp.]|uniref:hypothetical protein n=1 Tax=Mariniphaga sp. TaxID=1954475 RepID=UPI00356A5ACA